MKIVLIIASTACFFSPVSASPYLGFPPATCDTAVPKTAGIHTGLWMSDHWIANHYVTEYDWYRITVQPGQRLTVRSQEISSSPTASHSMWMAMAEATPSNCASLGVGDYVASLPGLQNIGMTVVNAAPTPKDYTIETWVWANQDYLWFDLQYNLIVEITTASTGVSYCPGAPNSVGSGGTLAVSGTNSVTANNLVFSAAQMPANGFALLANGTGQANAPFGDGTLCITGSLQRLYVVPVSASGACNVALDIPNLPPSAAVAAGDLRYFQLYYRDAAGPLGSGFNLTNAMAVPFTP
jgi:hypothetical protein